ncbi:MAG: ABC transporter permease [Terriglobia bacterium]|jgi:predicted permease
MRWIHKLPLRFRSLFRKSRAEADLSDELRFHLEKLIEEQAAKGMTPEEARYAALRELGGVEQIKEECRDMRRVNWIENFLQDVRYGLRMVGKSRGLTAILALTLALGIGVNTAIFSVLNGWLLRPLPVRAPEQIMVLAFQPKGTSESKFSYPDLLDFQKQADAFSNLFAYAPGGAGFSVRGEASEFAYSAVTGNYFSALGVKPLLGRLLLPSEGEKPGEELLVVLGYSFWQKRFGGDAAIVGKRVLVNGQPATIIGVTPKEFHGTLFAFDMDGYLSLNALPLVQDSSRFWTDRRDRGLMVLGRLKPGVSMAETQSSLAVIAQRLAAQYPATNQGATVRVIPERLARPAPFVTNFVPVIAGLFLVLPALVLLLACLNVANILLARATARQREMAIRAALGAGRGRLVRQMLTESLLLALLGGIGGVLLGEWATSASGSMLHSVTSTTSNVAFRLDYSFDWRVFAYTLGAVILSGIFLGVWPAFRAGRVDVNTVLHEGGRSDSAGVGRHGVRGVLLVAQVAGSLMLLIVAGLFVHSLERAEHMYLGFDPDRVLSVMLDVHQIGYDETRAKGFCRDLKSRVRAMPGVQSASLAFTVPLGMPSPASPIYIEGHPLAPGQVAPEVSFNSIDPAYFETMRLPLLEGRTFRDFDNETARPVAIVSQTMAKKFWPNQDPIGKRFSMKSATGPFIEVVGLARDGQSMWHFSPEPQPYFYLPLAQNFTSFLSLQVRTTVPPESLILGVQGQIRDLAPDLPIFDARTMQQGIHGLGGLFIFRLAAALAGVMGILGLTLATVGVYGVVSFGAAQRTREIGIRMALGATRRGILVAIVRQGLQLALIGIASGLMGAFALSRLLRSMLVGVKPGDPGTFIGVSLLLLSVALLASFIPARRATKVDPMVALRYE